MQQLFPDEREVHMKKKRTVFVAAFAACVLAIMLCIAGCGPDYTKNFQGTWQVVGMKDASGTDNAPVLEQLAAMGEKMTLTLKEDKSATFDMAQQENLTGTWKPATETECTISFDGYTPTQGKLSEDGKLVFEESGQTMTCEKQG